METVYVLFEQCRGYDDLDIVGVFKTKESAEKRQKDHENYEYFIYTELLQE